MNIEDYEVLHQMCPADAFRMGEMARQLDVLAGRSPAYTAGLMRSTATSLREIIQLFGQHCKLLVQEAKAAHDASDR